MHAGTERSGDQTSIIFGGVIHARVAVQRSYLNKAHLFFLLHGDVKFLLQNSDSVLPQLLVF